ncbi:MAG: hypothetical protein LBV50_04615 [Novosphingobium sp.]|jgi:2-dehydropantoate 2-reductase|nr:hypothetical protein [Novosphingobium sp.]
MEAIVREGLGVAAGLGITPTSDPLAALEKAGREAQEHQPSMLVDVLRRQRTEIAVLNAALVEAGERIGCPVPFNEAITAIVQGIEESWKT